MGKNKYIETPEKLWELFEEFVQHERNNPILKEDYVGKDGDKVYRQLDVPILFEAFEVWLSEKNIIQDLKDYASNKDGRYDDYAPIIARIRQFIFANNLKGAAVGIFQQNIIARKLGLIDKQKVEHQGEVNHTITGMEIK